MIEYGEPTMPTRACDLLAARAEEILGAHQQRIYVRTDRFFLLLLPMQWVATTLLALWWSPAMWDGAASSLHPHVALAFGMGGLSISLPGRRRGTTGRRCCRCRAASTRWTTSARSRPKRLKIRWCENI
jgi:hypothetical protein